MSKPLTHQVIALARSYITDERHWTQCYRALFKNGQEADPTDPRAWRFCATGALIRAGFDLTGDIAKADVLCRLACEAMRPEYISAVEYIESRNDDRGGHRAILDLFDGYLREEA
jgi:hypothetical protein